MAAPGFHSDWVTIKDHRVLLECRSSFPDSKMRFDARLAVEIVKNNSPDARVVRVFYDDKSECTNIKLSSYSQDDQVLERVVEGVFHTIFPGRITYCDVIIVDSNNKHLEHYNRTEHLSVEAGVAMPVKRDHQGNEKHLAGLDGLR